MGKKNNNKKVSINYNTNVDIKIDITKIIYIIATIYVIVK